LLSFCHKSIKKNQAKPEYIDRTDAYYFGENSSLLLNEIILENFMSYEYARIPLSTGLNVVCGPNGAGKSSILLAISVALGQVYTERSKKLSDLIRWGADSARITLLFNNRPQGQQLIPTFDGDFYRISRYLNREGDYWYEANFQTVNKSEVSGILTEFGVNPDNMLIIMHQHMMTEFGVTTSHKKLQMVEEAVGLGKYRQNVLEAKTKLSQVMSEEESVTSLLKNAEDTLEYWQNEYARYQQKKDFETQLHQLEQELLWARIIKRETDIDNWKNRIYQKKEDLKKIEHRFEKNAHVIQDLKQNLDKLHSRQSEIYKDLLALEKTKNELQNSDESYTNIIQEINDYEHSLTTDQETNNADPDTRVPITSILKAYSISSNRSELNLDQYFDNEKSADSALNELMTQIQLTKQEAESFEHERKRLNQLLNDKEKNEQLLQQDRIRLQSLTQQLDQLTPMMKAIDQLKQQQAKEDTLHASLKRELTNTVKSIPSQLQNKLPNDSLQLLIQLQAEIESRHHLEQSIQNNNDTYQKLIDTQQQIVADIQLYVNENEKLTKQQQAIHSYLAGTGEKPQIKCDKCGSILTRDQWQQHLLELEGALKLTTSQLTDLQKRLPLIQEKINNNKRENKELTNDQLLLERIQPIYTHITQLSQELDSSQHQLEKHEEQYQEFVHKLADVLEVDLSQTTGDEIEQQAHSLQVEIKSLHHGLPRLETKFNNFEELHIIPQCQRVAKALGALDYYQKLIPTITANLRVKLANLESQLEAARDKKQQIAEQIISTQQEFDVIEKQFKTVNEQNNEAEGKKSLLEFQKEKTNQEIHTYLTELEKTKTEYDQFFQQTTGLENRIETDRSQPDISSDIKVLTAHLTVLKDVSADVEQMYLSYLNLFNELKTKALVVAENREKTLTEVEDRKNVWRGLLERLLNDVNPIFHAFLSKVGATGHVRLVNYEDFHETGLELTVGFKGAEPHVLDSRTHSGGEKSTSTMAFLLALQRHIKSPFRAVDEFDVHMDPRNRELISQLLLSEMKNDVHSQYLTITPGQLTNIQDDVHVITVQRIEGKSEIKVTAHGAEAG
jgi:chromosome segregation ATPase